MSDLALAVAAVLRDKSNADLMEENTALRRRLSDRDAVIVTGPNGSPVYASAQLNDGSFLGRGADF
jgi:hypothetical protein